MPLYEYHCAKCDATVELLMRNSAEKAECPTCGTKDMQKLFSAPNGHVAGSSSSSLPMMPSGGCGKPACGMGGCGGI